LRAIQPVSGVASDRQDIVAPLGALSASDLLVNARHEPGLAHALSHEIPSADAIDLLCAFIRWHGLRLLEDHDAAELVDDKWPRAAAQAAEVTRWLTALPLLKRPRIVTTDGEFHSIRRQVDRLAEGGLAVTKVAARPADTLAERLASTLDAHTSCVMVSSVLFESAEMVPGLDVVADACRRHGASLLIDAYHPVAHVEPMAEDRRAGFLAIRAHDARRLIHLLRERGVHADARGETLRLGPAPYLRDEQLRDAIQALGEALRVQNRPIDL
jgi:hypothetical protein